MGSSLGHARWTAIIVSYGCHISQTILSFRQLNRAALARQMFARREKLGPVAAAESYTV